MKNYIEWWNNLTPKHKQNITNNFYCLFRQVFWKNVPEEDIKQMHKKTTQHQTT